MKIGVMLTILYEAMYHTFQICIFLVVLIHKRVARSVGYFEQSDGKLQSWIGEADTGQ